MFRRIEASPSRRIVRVRFEGREVQAFEGDSVAIALLQAGVETFRHTPVSGQARAPLCLMGVCFDCLVQVNGRPNVQACMVRVEEGMSIELQRGARRAET